MIAIDWGTLGTGPVGGDIGYFSLGSREAFEPLLDAYLMGLPEGLASPDDVLLGARVTAVYTVLTRAARDRIEGWLPAPLLNHSRRQKARRMPEGRAKFLHRYGAFAAAVKLAPYAQ